VHIVGTPISCDAVRASDVCFVSHAGAVAARRHDQIIATAPTLALLTRTERRQQAASQLAAPCGRPFTLGTVRLELFASGHCLGAASLLVERAGERIVYAGLVNPKGGGLGGAADVRSCTTLVVAARYAHPRHAFPDVADARAELRDCVAAWLAAGTLPVVLVTSPARGLDVAAELAGLGRPLRAHRSIHHASRRLGSVDARIPRLRRFAGGVGGEEVLLWPAAQRAALERSLLGSGRRVRLVLVSGRAAEPAEIERLGADAGVAWSGCADYAATLAYLTASKAERVYVTGRYADFLAATLDGAGLRVRAFGPPRQLGLFDRI
jgi:putative mRNA 3-end processing factor